MRDLTIYPDIDAMWNSLIPEAPRYMDPYVSDHRLHLPILAGEDVLYLGNKEPLIRQTREGEWLALANIQVGIGGIMQYASLDEIGDLPDVGTAFTSPRAWYGDVYHEGKRTRFLHYWHGFRAPMLTEAQDAFRESLDLTLSAEYYWFSTLRINPACVIEVYHIEEVLPMLRVLSGFKQDNEEARQHLAWVREGVELLELLRRSW